MTTRYGIISDSHEYPQNVEPALRACKQLGVNRILAIGDIGDRYNTMAYVLTALGKSGIETWASPGSHETLAAFTRAMGGVQEEYPTVHDATKIRKLRDRDHHIVFLPGSDTVSGGEFLLRNLGESRGSEGGIKSESENGKKLITRSDAGMMQRALADAEKEKRLREGNVSAADLYRPHIIGEKRNDELLLPQIVKRTTDYDEVLGLSKKYNHIEAEATPEGMVYVVYDKLLKGGMLQHEGATAHITDISDVEQLMTAPEQTIVAVHIPPKFDFPNAADIAFYGEKEYEAKRGKEKRKETAIIPGFVQLPINEVLGERYRVELKQENRGNEDLMDAIKKAYLREKPKVIFGHFHESVTRAHTLAGEKVEPDTPTNELFWNAACLDWGRIGLLDVEAGGVVQYQNVNLVDYIE